MNKADEAFDFALQKVEELKDEGIEVEFRKNNKEGWDDVRDSLEEKYKGDDNRVNPERWRQVCFKPDGEEETEKVFEAAQDLFEIGISFDTGAGLCCGAVWEFDWSFRVEGGVDEDKVEANSIVNELRKYLSSET